RRGSLVTESTALAARITTSAPANPPRRGAPLYGRSLHPFDDGGNALADADAHGREAVAAAAPFHFVQQRRHHPGAAAAERVSKGDGAAVDVQFIQIDAELARAGEHLGSKGLVELHQIDLIHG